MEATQNALHCQICAREIKAGNGKIAKHGYKVVYGSFTKSCAGAGYAPIEVSCERLEEYIETVKIWVTNWTNELTDLMENAPATLTYAARTSAWTTPENVTYEKPEGFNVNDLYGYKVRSYGGAFKVKKNELMQNIKYATKDIEEMEARAAGWHKEHDAPALEVAPVQEEETGAALAEMINSDPEYLEEMERISEGYARKEEAAALKASPIEVGDIVRPNTMYLHNATWTRAKVIGLHYYDSVDGKWVIDIQYMRSNWESGGYPYQFELTETKGYMLPVWEVELAERAAPSDLDRELEAIEARKREKIAALKASDFSGYNDAFDKELRIKGSNDIQKDWIQVGRALINEIIGCSDCINELCEKHSAAIDSFPPYPD